ncbi:unnamed protein product [Heligmosomoides polygyrus]|uniref:Uncharacterized protein n=1 Tax=Heligmosomoides polygyrus TaxID=6339 RepID=A0A183GWD6_HELPZ|nr:unnamed protein product [Heligmosomoides polygyrus]
MKAARRKRQKIEQENEAGMEEKEDAFAQLISRIRRSVRCGRESAGMGTEMEIAVRHRQDNEGFPREPGLRSVSLGGWKSEKAI